MIETKNLTELQHLLQTNQISNRMSDSKGNTLFHLSLIHDLPTIANIIIQNGWDPHIKNSTGKIPLHYAASQGHLQIVKKLIEENGCDPFSPEQDGLTPLHLAAYEDQTKIIEYYASCDFSLDVKENGNRTPLHYAAFKGYVKSLQLLISYGSDPDIMDINGNSSIFHTVGNHHVAATKILLNAGANIQIKNNDDHTIVDINEEEGNQEIQELLEKYNC